MLTMLATSAYRAVMIVTSVVVSFALGSIPFAGSWISFAFMCWVNASVSQVPVIIGRSNFFLSGSDITASSESL